MEGKKRVNLVVNLPDRIELQCYLLNREDASDEEATYTRAKLDETRTMWKHPGTVHSAVGAKSAGEGDRETRKSSP